MGEHRYKKGQIVSTLPKYFGKDIPILDEHSDRGGVSLAALPEARPDRTEEEKAKRQELIDSCTLTKNGAFLILRHRAKDRTDSGLFKPQDVRNQQSARMVTGTVIKVYPTYKKEFDDYENDEAALKPHDYIYFSEYAPFSAFKEFEEIQLIHSADILMKLTKLPPDAVED